MWRHICWTNNQTKLLMYSLPLDMEIPHILLLIYNVDEYKWLFELYVKVISVFGIYFTYLLWLVFYIIENLYVFSFGFNSLTFITIWIGLIVRMYQCKNVVCLCLSALIYKCNRLLPYNRTTITTFSYLKNNLKKNHFLSEF